MTTIVQILPVVVIVVVVALVILKFSDAWKSPQRQPSESLDSYHLRAISSSVISIKRMLLFWFMLTLLVGVILSVKR